MINRERGSSAWQGMVKGRLGYAYGRFLPYVTGGVAVRDLTQGESCPTPAAAPFGFCSTHGPFNLTKSKLQVAPVVGAGLEYAITDRLSVYGEYTHAFWGKTSFVLAADATTAGRCVRWPTPSYTGMRRDSSCAAGPASRCCCAWWRAPITTGWMCGG